jgi:mRNA-degrading endonuclease toxin of MazEF toxin-antitoxin module
VVVPLSTSTGQAARGPTAVELPAHTASLAKTSVAVRHQITTLDRSKLARRIGTLPAHLMKSVEQGIKAALDLD